MADAFEKIHYGSPGDAKWHLICHLALPRAAKWHAGAFHMPFGLAESREMACRIV
ncbi:hypothetical protein ACFO4N_14020 [Camelliibacillus cellulosilyticus]|uniref:Uncharacterized protein n=1 Tax=Camelliibacillus cellulosilyticus TaxID=2174486 RepID=A0ABV9GSZ2_9BACL